jgi:hypothetical protein
MGGTRVIRNVCACAIADVNGFVFRTSKFENQNQHAPHLASKGNLQIVQIKKSQVNQLPVACSPAACAIVAEGSLSLQQSHGA